MVKAIMKKAAMITALLLMLAFAVPSAAFAVQLGEDGESAQIPDRETEYFNVDIKVNENNTYEYTETVGAVFNTSGHGIYRNVPLEWNGIDVRVNNDWCSSDPVMTDKEDGFFVMQIGSADVLISGSHEFKYGYRITMKDDGNTEGDLLYIDLIPTDWQTPIESSEITVHLPKKVDKDAIVLYGGDYESEKLPDNIEWNYDGKDTIFVSGDNLEKGEGITLMVDLPEGYWVGQLDTGVYRTKAIGIIIIALLLFAIAWFIFGRRQHVVETVEFHPPEGVAPAEIGLIIDGSLDKKDMMSMLMYFAQKGYMKIKEANKDFVFIKEKEIGSNEETYAHLLFNGMFRYTDTAESNNMGTAFGNNYLSACELLKDKVGSVMDAKSKWVQTIGGVFLYIIPLMIALQAVYYCFNKQGFGFAVALIGMFAAFMAGKLRKSYRNRNSGKKTGKRIVRCIYWLIDIVALLVFATRMGGIFESGTAGILIFICLTGCHVFNVCFDRLSKHAYELMGKIMGLRNFIKTAELNKLNELVEENPEYFYDILPYAYVLGLTDKWAKKFENIKIEIPSWFETDSDVVYIPSIYMGSAMNNISTELGHSITKIDSSIFSGGSDHGGGFSGGGGGFSGGGAGGGGGGFW